MFIDLSLVFSSIVNLLPGYKMFNRMKTALYNVVGGLETIPQIRDGEPTTEANERLPLKFRYTRPHFLQLNSDDEIQVSADIQIRPIICPRDINKLPWNTGYAEAVNAGKSYRNEDEACIYHCFMYKDTPPSSSPQDNPEKVISVSSSSAEFSKLQSQPHTSSISWMYFGIFDGHAGSGVSVASANTLHKIIQEKFENVYDLLLNPSNPDSSSKPKGITSEKTISRDALITGALEHAFWEMDQLIEHDKQQYKMTGGCTALAAVFMFGKLYVANAGDSRAVIFRPSKIIPMSQDFTPESERERVRHLAYQRPEFLGRDFTELEFSRRPQRKDIGKKMLYRESFMTGWAYKIITPEDLKFPLVYGEGKRSRVLATIGVTRGFGDHELRAQGTNIYIKPFLTCQPEVRIFDLMVEDLTDSDVLVMGTDGLWDISSNEKAHEIVQKALEHFPANDAQKYRYRYISAAQDLVMHSRGKLRENMWKTAELKSATIDDISVFVIPLKAYANEYAETLASKSAIPEINGS